MMDRHDVNCPFLSDFGGVCTCGFTAIMPGGLLDISKLETPEPDTNPKKAHGALKAPMSFTPNTALIELNAVMGGGAHKYGPFNFRDSQIDASTYIGAIRRHLFLWEDGEDKDEESNRSHLAHVMACCALALDAMHTGKFVDNRSKTGVVKGLLKECADDHNAFVKTYDMNQKNKERRKPLQAWSDKEI